MPDELPLPPQPQGRPRFFDESEAVVDPALENLSNGSLTAHRDRPGSDEPEASEVGDEPDLG